MNEFKIDIAELAEKSRRHLNKRVVGVEINTPPGLTFIVDPHDPEVTAARRVLIFMKDRRALNSQECCDNCIDRSLASLEKIREHIVAQQQELANLADGVLYLMLEFLVDSIRQFSTFSERLEREYERSDTGISDFQRHPDAREAYFAALNRLRRHLTDTLYQIRVIAGEEPQSVPENLKFKGWTEDAYLESSETCVDLISSP